MQTEFRRDARRASRVLPTWLGGTLAVAVTHGPWLLAVLSGYNDPPKSHTLVGLGLLALVALPIAVLTLAAPAYGMTRREALWRLWFPVWNVRFVWQLGLRAMEAVNRAAR